MPGGARIAGTLVRSAVVCAVLTVAAALFAAPGCLASSWAPAEAITLPANASTGAEAEAQINSVACGAAGRCVAVGAYTDTSHESEPMVTTDDGGSWSAASELEVPAGHSTKEPGGGLDAVACPEAEECVAVGSYTDAAGEEAPMVVGQVLGAWQRATAVQLPGNATGGGKLDAIACVSAKTCVAAGGYETSAGFTPMVAREGASWERAEEVAAPEGSVRAEFASIACPFVGDCVAVGTYATSAGGTEMMGAVEQSQVWGGASEVLAPADEPASVFVTPGLSGVSCISTGDCLAVGSYENESGLSALVAAQFGGGWGQAQGLDVLPAGAREGEGDWLRSIACGGGGECTAVGGYVEGEDNSVGMATGEVGGVWEQGTEILPPAGISPYTDELVSVACPAAGDCVAVGNATERSGTNHPYVVSQTAAPPPRIVPPPLSPPAACKAPTLHCPPPRTQKQAGEFSFDGAVRIDLGTPIEGVSARVLNYSPWISSGGSYVSAWDMLERCEHFDDCEGHSYDQLGWNAWGLGESERETLIEESLWQKNPSRSPLEVLKGENEKAVIAQNCDKSPQPPLQCATGASSPQQVGTYTDYTVLWNVEPGWFTFEVNGRKVARSRDSGVEGAFVPHAALLLGEVHSPGDQMPGDAENPEIFDDAQVLIDGRWQPFHGERPPEGKEVSWSLYGFYESASGSCIGIWDEAYGDALPAAQSRCSPTHAEPSATVKAAGHATAGAGKVSLPLSCPSGGTGCEGTIQLEQPHMAARTRGTPVSKAVAFSLPPGQSEKLTVKLTRAAAHRLARRRKLTVRGVVTAPGAGGVRVRRYTASIRLTPAPPRKRTRSHHGGRR